MCLKNITCLYFMDKEIERLTERERKIKERERVRENERERESMGRKCLDLTQAFWRTLHNDNITRSI